MITIRGSLDTLVAYHLQEQFDAKVAQGYRKYVIDLKELEYLSSAGIGLFSAMFLELQRHRGSIIFVNIPENIYDVLRLTRLTEKFTITETLDDAIACLNTDTSAA